MRGKLFGFDGGDFSGKKTQTDLLHRALEAEGLPVLSMSFPRYSETHFGRGLRELLDGVHGDFISFPPEIASVPYAFDRLASKPLITEALGEGTHVILDRYVSANQIHQGGKFECSKERIKFLEWLDWLEFEVCGLPRPDVMVYLDVPPDVSNRLNREGTRDLAESNEMHIRASYEAAQWLMTVYSERWLHIHCVAEGNLRSREDIHAEVLDRLRTRLQF